MRTKIAVLALAATLVLAGCGAKLGGPTTLPPKPDSKTLQSYTSQLRAINPRVNDADALTARNVCNDNRHDSNLVGNTGRQVEHAKTLYGADDTVQAKKMIALAEKLICK